MVGSNFEGAYMEGRSRDSQHCDLIVTVSSGTVLIFK